MEATAEQVAVSLPLLQHTLRLLAEDCLRLFGMDMALAVLVTPDKPPVKAWAGPVPPELEGAEMPPVPALCPDTEAAGHEHWHWLSRYGLRCVVGVPLVTERGSVAGALYVMRAAPGPLPDALIPLLELLGRQVLGRLSGPAALAGIDLQEALMPGSPLERRTDAILVVSPTGVILSVDPAGEALIGMERSHLVGRSIDVLYPPEAQEECWRQLAQAAAGLAGRWQAEWLTAAGERREVLISSVPEKVTDSVSAIYWQARDLVGVHLQEPHPKIAEERLRFRLTGTPVAVFTVGTTGRILAANAAGEQLTGYTREQLVGADSRLLIAPEDLARTEFLRDEMVAGRPAGELELRLHRADGTWLPVTATVVPIFDQGGCTGVHVLVRGSAERKAVEEGMHFLAEADAVLAGQPDFRCAVQMVADLALSRLCEGFAIRVPSPGTEPFLCTVAHREPAKADLLRQVVSDLAAASPTILLAAEARDLGALALSGPQQEAALSLGVGSWMSVPLVDRSETIGLISLLRGQGDQPFRPQEMAVVQELALRLADRMRESRLDHEAMWAALHHPRTGLPTRALLAERVAQTLEQSTKGQPSFAVLSVDLDYFKVVTDSLGQAAGGRFLSQSVRRLQRCVPVGSMLAQTGEHGFMLLLRGLEDTSDAVSVAKAIQAAFHPPFQVDGYELVCTPTIGLVMGNQAASVDELLRFAEMALDEAKRRGGGGSCEPYLPSMSLQALHRLVIEEELRQAIRREEFILHYQPVFDLQTGRVAGVEALVRWVHPSRGLVMPGEFIALAEETGVIVPLGLWVLRTACRELVAWDEAGLSQEPIWLSVNLSARQLTSPTLVEDVKGALAESGLAPGRLGLELTETALIQHGDLASAVLAELQALGISIALDDFGVGYASLSYLQRFRINVLKLDRSFVHGVGTDDRTSDIARAIIDLAGAFSLDVTAEGVEEPSQAKWLKQQGVIWGQGYGLARPSRSPLTNLP